MTCSSCDKHAVIDIPYSGRSLCREHFLRFFDKRVKAEIQSQGRLPPGKIAVALSGGKDSISVLHILAQITKTRPDIELNAITIDEGIAGYRDSSLDICRDVTTAMGIEWRVIKTKDLAGYTIDEYALGKDPTGNPVPACGPCGVFRRLGMNQLAKDIGASALVTGHNLDDMAQTVLMNVLKGDVDRLARLAPHTERREGMVPRLIPLRSIPEKEVLLYAVLHGLPLHHEAECPYAVRAHRFEMRDTLLALEARTPGTRHSLIRFHDRLKPLIPNFEGELNPCTLCGQPTSGQICKPCQWRDAKSN